MRADVGQVRSFIRIADWSGCLGPTTHLLCSVSDFQRAECTAPSCLSCMQANCAGQGYATELAKLAALVKTQANTR